MSRSVLEEAFLLAESGELQTVDEVKAVLISRGFSRVDVNQRLNYSKTNRIIRSKLLAAAETGSELEKA